MSDCDSSDCQPKTEDTKLIKIEIFAESNSAKAFEMLIRCLNTMLSVAKNCLPDSKKFSWRITEVDLDPGINASSFFTQPKIDQTQPDS